jgi:membrane associated rhomboid family serine protease
MAMQSLLEISVEMSISAVLVVLLFLGDRSWRLENARYLDSLEARERSAKRVKRIKIVLYFIAPLCTVPLSLSVFVYIIPQIPLLSLALGGASGAIFAIALIKSLKELKWERLFPPCRSPYALVKLAALGFLACSAILLLYPVATDSAARQKVMTHFSESKGGKG